MSVQKVRCRRKAFEFKGVGLVLQLGSCSFVGDTVCLDEKHARRKWIVDKVLVFEFNLNRRGDRVLNQFSKLLDF